MVSETFPNWFREQLRRRDWNMSDFSRRSGFSTGVVGHWARGSRVPSPESCDRIADVLGVDVDTVLTLAGHRPAVEPLALDDPAARLSALLRRVELTPDRAAGLEATIRAWIDFDRASRQSRSSS